MTAARDRPMSRRGALGVLAGLGAGATGLLALLRGSGMSPRPVVAAGTVREVEPFPGGTGEWWLPPVRTGPAPAVVLIHGGYWRAGYDRGLENAVAADLAGRGFVVWNLDYRSSAAPWPATLTDVAAGFDQLAVGRHAHLLDPARIAVVGHSAGGHLALWLASRARLGASAPGGNRPSSSVALVVAQAPVAALARAIADGLGGGAVQALLGGTAAQQAERLTVADPLALVPTAARTVLVHGTSDSVVPLSQSELYVAAATAAGGRSTLVPVPGGHFEHLDPTSPACAALRRALASL